MRQSCRGNRGNLVGVVIVIVIVGGVGAATTASNFNISAPQDTKDVDANSTAPETGAVEEEAVEIGASLDSPAPPSPESLRQSHIDSILAGGGAEGLKKLLEAHGGGSPQPSEISGLLSHFTPKKLGRLHPSLLDLLELGSQQQEEDGDGGGAAVDDEAPWTPIHSPPPPPPPSKSSSTTTTLRSPRSKYSARYVGGMIVSSTTAPPSSTLSRPSPPSSLYNMVTDPNLRNHRLYPYHPEEDFEDYKNFTHIDQAEDLLAESSEQEVRRRPVSMEGMRFDSNGDLEGSSSHQHHPFNLLRPREPLRESSTENHFIRRHRYRSEEVGGQGPVFIDPDQDFFTSTIRAEGAPSSLGRWRPLLGDEDITELSRDPRPYPPPLQQHLSKGTKMDRILGLLQGGGGGPASYYGVASNEVGGGGGGGWGGVVEEVYAGSHGSEYPHPFAPPDNQPEYSSYAPNSNEGWSSTYWVLGGLVALSAITAFLLPTLLHGMGRRNGKHRHDLKGEEIDEYPEEEDKPSSSSTTTTTQGGGDTGDKDLWTEIKGVYNDVVRIVRGDYGGIVDKLGGGVSKKGEPIPGPNIIYTDEDEEEVVDEGVGMIGIKSSGHGGKLKRRGGAIVGSSNKKKKKNKTISSSLNFAVTSEGVDGETARSVPLNDSSGATFYFPPSTTRRPGGLSAYPTTLLPGGFMGEWAKVQLIGS